MRLVLNALLTGTTALLLSAACNMITGVDGLQVGGGAPPSASTTTTRSGAGGSGAGITTASGGAGATTATGGDGTGATGATTGTGGDGTGAAGATTGTGGDGTGATGWGGSVAGCNGSAVPDFDLLDVNPTSGTYDTMVSPRDYLALVSAWYFGNAT